MKLRGIEFCAIVLIAISSVAAPPADVVRLEVKEKLTPGRGAATFLVYASAEGGTPLVAETVAVQVDANGSIVTPLGSLLHLASSGQERWLSVRVGNGGESARVKISRAGSPPATVHVVTDAAITANGIVESIAQGFRFPDGSVQTSAATVSGGVPSVNGIGSAVTIIGSGSVNVGTAGSTITVNGPPFGTPVAISTSNAEGISGSITRADHTHAHGNLSGGSLHSTATTGTAGFLSASDKTKLDSLVTYAKTVIVSPTGADATANGTLLVNALNGITGNSSSNPFLLKIEPGVYNIGGTALTMKQYVDIEGSGENATFITATRGSTSVTSAAAAVIGAINSEIRHLTISNTASTTHGAAYFASGSGTMRLTHVTINSTGGTTFSHGIYATSSAIVSAFRITVTSTGVGGSSSTAGLTGATATTIQVLASTITGKGVGGTGSNYGVATSSSTCVLTIDSSTIVGTGTSNGNFGVWVDLGNATVLNSTVRVDTAASRIAVGTAANSNAILKVSHSLLFCFQTGSASAMSSSKGANSTLRIGTSLVDGASAGTPTCVHVYDGNYADLNNVCPVPIA